MLKNQTPYHIRKAVQYFQEGHNLCFEINPDVSIWDKYDLLVESIILSYKLYGITYGKQMYDDQINIINNKNEEMILTGKLGGTMHHRRGRRPTGDDDIDLPIIGTMNDFDKNLLLTELSYGLITRFAFVDIEPDRDKEKESVKVQIVGRNKIEDTDYEACKGEITGFLTFINKVRDVRMIGVRTCIDVIRYMVTASKNHSDGRKDYLDEAMCDYLLPQFDRLDRRTLEETKKATKGLGAKKFTDGLQKLLDDLERIMAAFDDVEKKEE